MEHDTIEAVWGHRLLDEGFLAIPNIVVRNYRHLGIEHGEFGFICTILTYKHDTKDPYPSQEKLAAHMKCSTRQVQKWIDSLYNKGLLLVGQRQHPTKKQWGHNVYNFRPLIEKALAYVGQSPLPPDPDDYDIVYKKPSVPEVRMESESPSEPEVRTVPEVRPVPEVRMEHEPEVRISGPEVRTNISLEYITENKTPDPTILTHDFVRLLQPRFTPQTYDMWFTDMQVTEVGGVLYVQLPTTFAASYVQSHYKDYFIAGANKLGYATTNVEFDILSTSQRQEAIPIRAKQGASG